MKAFPYTYADKDKVTIEEGMELVDYFAAKAMAALITTVTINNETEDYAYGALASDAYKFAKAMIYERNLKVESYSFK